MQLEEENLGAMRDQVVQMPEQVWISWIVALSEVLFQSVWGSVLEICSLKRLEVD